MQTDPPPEGQGSAVGSANQPNSTSSTASGQHGQPGQVGGDQLPEQQMQQTPSGHGSGSNNAAQPVSSETGSGRPVASPQPPQAETSGAPFAGDSTHSAMNQDQPTRPPVDSPSNQQEKPQEQVRDAEGVQTDVGVSLARLGRTACLLLCNLGCLP